MRTGILVIISLITTDAFAGFGGTLTAVAAGTTIAVNSHTIAGWLRHPKRTVHKAVQESKAIIRGKSPTGDTHESGK